MGNAQITSLLVSVLAGTMVIFLRLRASNRPTTLRKIMIPPMGMATGFMMFIVPDTRIPWAWAGIAFLVGAVLFSVPLIRTTQLEIRDETVYMKRSKAFLWIIIGMLLVRVLLHDWVERYITVVQSAGVFFILAFGMILVWRIAMLRSFLSLTGRKPGVHQAANE
ncbi:MAG: rane protein [Paenibacillaceae bacterium]|jgi:membrane protein CcdC involved in cytochrome C biogenesis|nr:rane protein [Paenibacillaceae bacterium]